MYYNDDLSSRARLFVAKYRRNSWLPILGRVNELTPLLRDSSNNNYQRLKEPTVKSSGVQTTCFISYGLEENSEECDTTNGKKVSMTNSIFILQSNSCRSRLQSLATKFKYFLPKIYNSLANYLFTMDKYTKWQKTQATNIYQFNNVHFMDWCLVVCGSFFDNNYR